MTDEISYRVQQDLPRQDQEGDFDMPLFKKSDRPQLGDPKLTDPDVERGFQLEAQGDTDGAAAAYSRADQRGDAQGAFSLGILLRQRGDLAGAEQAYARADQRGDPRASCNLAVLLEGRGDLVGAEAAYRRADAMGFPGGAYGLGQLLYARGDVDGSIAANRRADELGDADAAYNLGVLLKQRDDPEGSEGAFSRADQRGSAAGATAYGRAREDRGDLTSAESAYRRAEERGDPDGTFNLGCLFIKQDRIDDGIQALRRALESGHPRAAEVLNLVEKARSDADPGGGNVGRATAGADDVTAIKWAQTYAATCAEVITTTNACVEIANQAVGARNMTQRQDQHESSRQVFAGVAEDREKEFVPRYRAFLDTCDRARNAAANLLACCPGQDPEALLLASVTSEAYGATGTAIHILRAEFGPTPARFVEGLQAANAAIQADIFSYGEDGFQGNVYAPPALTERACPWCAETIKAAAVICRFCGRDVAAGPDVQR
jgi:tetratricopeptide (TPR) repeat protein